ncbi:MAG: macro domain-containing protein [Acidimicrobiales bacterium]|jgi:O-acetyl-ADP-ribose deacetylase (regulator of RNase III)|nr:macro domain-containing protein [Acidimicrobiales bacterium]
MIHYVTGDILLTDADAVAHGVAPGDDFAQGLALSLREQWPAMYKDFRHWDRQFHPKPGEAWAWAGAGGPRIVALLTQDRAERSKHERAKVEHVNHALKALRQLLDDDGIASVALPRLATGVGGLEWDEVKPLVEHHLGDADATVYVYETFHKGEKAAEPA